MNFYKIALLLVASFSRSTQGEGCYPPPCAHGQFFCTHSGTACCDLDSDFCSPQTKDCERALYNVTEGEEIIACCTFLTEEEGEDADYQRGSFEEGKLQVCKYLLGALTWKRTCANLDKGTTAQPESSRSSATSNNPDINTRDASMEGQDTVRNCPDCNTFVVVVIVLGVIIVILLVCAISCLFKDYSTLKKKVKKIICRKDSSNRGATQEETRSGVQGGEEREPFLEGHGTGNVPATGVNRDMTANSSARFGRSGSQEDSSSKSDTESFFL